MKLIIEIFCVLILAVVAIRSYKCMNDGEGTFVILWFPIFCLPTILAIIATICDITN